MRFIMNKERLLLFQVERKHVSSGSITIPRQRPSYMFSIVHVRARSGRPLYDFSTKQLTMRLSDLFRGSYWRAARIKRMRETKSRSVVSVSLLLWLCVHSYNFQNCIHVEIIYMHDCAFDVCSIECFSQYTIFYE